MTLSYSSVGQTPLEESSSIFFLLSFWLCHLPSSGTTQITLKWSCSGGWGTLCLRQQSRKLGGPRVWMCLGSGSTDLNTNLQQEMLVSLSRDGNQQIVLAVNCKEEAMSGDPLGNKWVLVKILLRCVNLLCEQKYPEPWVCETLFWFWIFLFVFVFLFPKVWLCFLGKTQRYA